MALIVFSETNFVKTFSESWLLTKVPETPYSPIYNFDFAHYLWHSPMWFAANVCRMGSIFVSLQQSASLFLANNDSWCQPQLIRSPLSGQSIAYITKVKCWEAGQLLPLCRLRCDWTTLTSLYTHYTVYITVYRVYITVYTVYITVYTVYITVLGISVKGLAVSFRIVTTWKYQDQVYIFSIFIISCLFCHRDHKFHDRAAAKPKKPSTRRSHRRQSRSKPIWWMELRLAYFSLVFGSGPFSLMSSWCFFINIFMSMCLNLYSLW